MSPSSISAQTALASGLSLVADYIVVACAYLNGPLHEDIRQVMPLAISGLLS